MTTSSPPPPPSSSSTPSAEVALVDDVDERAAPVEQAQDPVDLVGDLGEPIDELAVIDLEDAIERRQLLEQTAPLVDAPHALHEQALRRQLDHVGLVVRPE